MINDIIIGGVSSVISRTLTAPLELYKTQKQNSFMPYSTLSYVIKKEGFHKLWKGNLTNCLRILPQNSINYCLFSYFKSNHFKNIENKELKHFISSNISGLIAMSATYPLETIRTRLSLQSSNKYYHNIYHAFRIIPNKDLYRGLKISLIGFVPFNSITFTLYYYYKNILNKYNYNIEDNIINFISGGLSGLSAITITYPTDLIRKRLQLQNFDKHVPKYNGIIDCIKKIYLKEGIIGLYRGLPATYIKIFFTFGIQFYLLDIFNDNIKYK